MALLEGRGVAKDPFQGARWIRRAADGGLARAQTHLGLLYLRGEGVGKAASAALHWLRKAANNGAGDPEAQVRLAGMLQNGQGVKHDPAGARVWLEKAAAQGSAEAVEALARLDAGGTIEPEPEPAPAPESADAPVEDPADPDLGIGEGDPGDDPGEDPDDELDPVAPLPPGEEVDPAFSDPDPPGLEELRKRRAGGDAADLRALGSALRFGCGGRAGIEEAYAVLEAAWEAGDVQAAYLRARMAERGEGRPVDYYRASEWYDRARKKGSWRAGAQLAIMASDGRGIDQDFDRAAKLFVEAATRGDHHVVALLAVQQLQGVGLFQDLKSGERFVERAAAMGNGDAFIAKDIWREALHTHYLWNQVSVDRMRRSMELARQSREFLMGWQHCPDLADETLLAPAATIFQDAADERDPWGLTGLGMLYRKGLGGIPFDPARARELFQGAADQGNVLGHRLLIAMGSEG